MGKSVNDQELAGVSALSAPERYSHFIRQVADWQQVWALHSSAGWVMAGDDKGQRYMPVWPHARYAEVCATGPWTGSASKAIPLSWI
jgi:hypothetical protein